MKRFKEPGVNLRHLTASLSRDKKSTVVLCLALQQKGCEIIKECVRLHKDGVTSCKSVDGVCKKEDPSGEMRNEVRSYVIPTPPSSSPSVPLAGTPRQLP